MDEPWCRTRYVTDSGREVASPDTASGNRVSTDALSLYFSGPVRQWMFQPESPWASISLSRPRPPRIAGVADGGDLRCALRRAVARCIGDAMSVAVAVSGGLDSATVLAVASEIMVARGGRLTAIVIPATDDRGQSNVPIAQRLASALAPDASLQVTSRHRTSAAVHHWSPVGPSLESTPLDRRAANLAAAELGCEVILTGVGADEMLACPRYLAPSLMPRALKAWSYLRDIGGVTIPAALALESLAFLARGLPRRTSAALYAAANNAELLPLEPSNLLHPRRRPAVEAWSHEWFDAWSASVGRHPTWAEADYFDAISPYDDLLPAGPIPELAPFLHPVFAAVANAVPLTERYSSQYLHRYHRRKHLLVSTLPESVVPLLPPAKQTYADDLGRYHEQHHVRPQLIGELDIVRQDRGTDFASRLISSAVEVWVRGAAERGARFV